MTETDRPGQERPADAPPLDAPPLDAPPVDAPPVDAPPADAPVVPAPRAGVVRTILGRDEDDDRPLPDLPALPADPRWRIEHLPFVVAVGMAFVLCAASVGFFVGGPAAALGAAAGVLVVTVGVTMTTLVIAWADAVRPALVLPFGLTIYVIKYSLIVFLLFAVSSSNWSGARPMIWGVAVGAILITGVQAWWLTRLARRHMPGPRATAD